LTVANAPCADSYRGPHIVIDGKAWRIATPAEARDGAGQLPEVLQEAAANRKHG
jgi:hypothetical protein